jgi:hypothetical protein
MYFLISYHVSMRRNVHNMADVSKQHLRFARLIAQQMGCFVYNHLVNSTPHVCCGMPTLRNNLLRIRVSLICKLSGTLDLGTNAPDTRSLCPSSSAEFVEPPHPEKILGTSLPTGSCLHTYLRYKCRLPPYHELGDVGSRSLAVSLKGLLRCRGKII